MEEKIFYGKTTSPKVIAEASLAYSFSFDLQRFADEGYTGWSIGAGDGDLKDKLVYMSNNSAIASLVPNDTNSSWSLSGGSENATVELNFNDTQGSVKGSDISSSITSGTFTSFDATALASPFKFTLGSNAKLTSIVGSSKGDTIDASEVTNGNLTITGGSGNDSFIAGKSGTFYLDGGAGDDSLVGGTGKDYFIYSAGIDSIFNYGTNDFISLTGSATLPGVTGVATTDSALVLGFNNNNSLAVNGEGAKNSTVRVLFQGTSGTSTYSYNKNYIQLGNDVSLTPDVDKFTAFNTGSIDATGVTNTNGVWINTYKGGNTVIGSNTQATSVYGGAGNDFVSLAGSKKDVFIYGGGNDTIVSLGSANGTFVSLGAKNYKTLIQDGSALTSVSAGVFKLAFDNNNSLTFKDAKAAVSIRGFNTTDSLVYTPTAITSISGTNKSVTLGASFDSFTFNGKGYKVVDGSAVSSVSSSGTFAISIGGESSYAAYAIGSNYHVTSILGSSGADTLQAGTKGASLVGNGGDDLLIGGSGTDYFIYGHNTTGRGGNVTIRNYTYGTDFVSLGGAAYPTTDIDKITLQSGKSNFIISLGSNAEDSVLTFESATKVDLVSVGSGNHDTLFHYEADKIIVDDNRITLGAAYKSNFNANANTWTNSEYKLSSIDASHVTVANGINITGYAEAGNSIIGAQFGGKIVGSESSDYIKSGVTVANGQDSYSTTIDAGEAGTDANDTLVGGTGNDWFIYRGAKASIGSYTSNADSIQIVGFNMVGDDVPTFASMPTASKDLVLTFGTGSSLSIAGGAATQSVVTFRNGNHTFEYSAGTVSLDNKSVTLTAEYNPATHYIAQGTIATVNAEAVSTTGGVVSLGANATLGTRLIGSTTLANSLRGGAGNDYLVGGNAADVFEYTGGKDTVSNYTFSQADSLVAADTLISDIKSGRVSGSKLIFTGNTKGNVLTFLSEDDAIEKVSLGGGGYLTKDAYVGIGANSKDSLKFFSSARGTIELTNSLYKVSDANANAIASVDASAVKQSVTLVADSLSTESVYILPGNKKKDRFEYAGGKVSISGYETGKDQLNLGIGTISGFKVSGNDVLISLNSSSANVVSIAGGNDLNFLVHQSSNGNNVYRKMAFTKSGILTDKASKPTTVTVLGGAHSLNANEFDGGTIKRIYAASGDVGNISITASDKNNTLINMGVAGAGVSIYGGKKNDKITGSETHGDLFVYKTDGGVGGKDVITNFGEGDKISLGANPVASLNGANITARNKGVTFKFDNKNSLNLKSDDTVTAVTLAGDTTDTVYTFKKNAFSANGGTNVNLTSGFAGNFNINKTKVGDNAATNVNGSNVTRNLTFTGTSSGETLVGGKKKTTFKAAGGQDSLVGGSGKDIFFYAKGNAGTTTIVDFDYTNDKIKLASGTLAKIETIGTGVQLAMKDNSGNNVGWYQITGSMSYNKDGSKKTDATNNKPSATNTVFKANNTYYWFAQNTIIDEVTVKGSESKETVTLASAGDLVTSDTRVSASKVSDYDVIELNYSTNLVRAGLAVATSKATLPTKSS